MAIVVGWGLGSLFATAGVKVVQTVITGDETLQHLQETNTVCGTIASAKYVVGAPGNPTYLNLDRPFPNQSCSIAIAESIRSKFKDAPETALTGKWVCVTGVITTDYRGKPQIPVSDPAQIVVGNAPAPSATNQTTVPTAP